MRCKGIDEVWRGGKGGEKGRGALALLVSLPANVHRFFRFGSNQEIWVCPRAWTGVLTNRCDGVGAPAQVRPRRSVAVNAVRVAEGVAATVLDGWIRRRVPFFPSAQREEDGPACCSARLVQRVPHFAVV